MHMQEMVADSRESGLGGVVTDLSIMVVTTLEAKTMPTFELP